MFMNSCSGGYLLRTKPQEGIQEVFGVRTESLAGDEVVGQWEGGRVRSSAAGIRLWPDIPSVPHVSRVQASRLFGVCSPGIFGTFVCSQGRRIDLTCHLPLGRYPRSCEPHPGSHRNVVGVASVEPCPCMVKQITSP